MNIDNEIIQTSKTVDNIMEVGYSRQEALQLVQAAALSKLSECVYDYNGKTYLRIAGQVATFEQ